MIKLKDQYHDTNGTVHRFSDNTTLHQKREREWTINQNASIYEKLTSAAKYLYYE